MPATKSLSQYAIAHLLRSSYSMGIVVTAACVATMTAMPAQALQIIDASDGVSVEVRGDDADLPEPLDGAEGDFAAW